MEKKVNSRLGLRKFNALGSDDYSGVSQDIWTQNCQTLRSSLFMGLIPLTELDCWSVDIIRDGWGLCSSSVRTVVLTEEDA